MKVTPVNKKFGKYSPGDVFDFPDKPAKVFIKIGKLAAAVHQATPTYQTRMMQAEPAIPAVILEPAPYGYKADGTPRKRPGRPVSAE